MNILVLCTGNSARSILGESILNRLGGGKITAYSAGSKPTGLPNPFAINLLNDKGFDTSGARSKSWDEFSGSDAPSMDLIITVCDNAANETCPIWPSRNGVRPTTWHWPFPDPAAATGSDDEIAKAFQEVYDMIYARAEEQLSEILGE